MIFTSESENDSPDDVHATDTNTSTSKSCDESGIVNMVVGRSAASFAKRRQSGGQYQGHASISQARLLASKKKVKSRKQSVSVPTTLPLDLPPETSLGFSRNARDHRGSRPSMDFPTAVLQAVRRESKGRRLSVAVELEEDSDVSCGRKNKNERVPPSAERCSLSSSSTISYDTKFPVGSPRRRSRQAPIAGSPTSEPEDAQPALSNRMLLRRLSPGFSRFAPPKPNVRFVLANGVRQQSFGTDGTGFWGSLAPDSAVLTQICPAITGPRRVVDVSDHKTCALLMAKMKEANATSPP